MASKISRLISQPLGKPADDSGNPSRRPYVAPVTRRHHQTFEEEISEMFDRKLLTLGMTISRSNRPRA
jgi:hypothetical protein